MFQQEPDPQGNPNSEYQLRWTGHTNQIITVFHQLFQDRQFTDVVLSTGTENFCAHRIVLSACSPYFHGLFLLSDSKDLIIILKDVPARHVELLMEFMYRGTVSVRSDELPALLKTAKDLRIQGLVDNYGPEVIGANALRAQPRALIVDGGAAAEGAAANSASRSGTPNPQGQDQFLHVETGSTHSVASGSSAASGSISTATNGGSRARKAGAGAGGRKPAVPRRWRQNTLENEDASVWEADGAKKDLGEPERNKTPRVGGADDEGAIAVGTPPSSCNEDDMDTDQPVDFSNNNGAGRRHSEDQTLAFLDRSTANNNVSDRRPQYSILGSYLQASAARPSSLTPPGSDDRGVTPGPLPIQPQQFLLAANGAANLYNDAIVGMNRRHSLGSLDGATGTAQVITSSTSNTVNVNSHPFFVGIDQRFPGLHRLGVTSPFASLAVAAEQQSLLAAAAAAAAQQTGDNAPVNNRGRSGSKSPKSRTGSPLGSIVEHNQVNNGSDDSDNKLVIDDSVTAGSSSAQPVTSAPGVVPFPSFDIADRLRNHFLASLPTQSNFWLGGAGGLGGGLAGGLGGASGGGGLAIAGAVAAPTLIAPNVIAKGGRRTSGKRQRGDHPSGGFKTGEIGPNGKQTVECEICGKRLADPSSLYRHRKIHSGDKPHKCPHCSRRMHQYSNMKNHIQTHTRPKKPRSTSNKKRSKKAPKKADPMTAVPQISSQQSNNERQSMFNLRNGLGISILDDIMSYQLPSDLTPLSLPGKTRFIQRYNMKQHIKTHRMEVLSLRENNPDSDNDDADGSRKRPSGGSSFSNPGSPKPGCSKDPQ